MRIEFRLGDVLDDTADAVIITVDPASKKTLGKVAFSLAKRIGEAEWEYLLEQVRFPFRVGEAQLAEIDSEAVAFRHVIVAGAFDHFAEGTQHAENLRRALRSAFKLAADSQFQRVSMAFSKAGWRLIAADAGRALMAAASELSRPTLSVSTLDEAEFVQLRELAARSSPTSKP